MRSGGLSHVRQKLDDEAARIHHDIVEFASQSVVQLTNIVSDGMTHVAKVAEAPGIAEDTPASDPAAIVLKSRREATASRDRSQILAAC
jgi:hypothetical protein